jgi:hypothetical protein
VQGSGSGPDGQGQGKVLALRSLATVPVGQLAAAGATELPEMWRGLLLVPQPKEHRVQRLRDANSDTLTGGKKGRKIAGKRCREAAFQPKKAVKTAVKRGFSVVLLHSCAIFTIDGSDLRERH